MNKSRISARFAVFNRALTALLAAHRTVLVTHHSSLITHHLFELPTASLPLYPFPSSLSFRCLLPSALRPPPTAFCFLLPASCFQSTACIVSVEELQKRLKAAGYDSYIGVVRFAGPALKNTEKQVQFDAAGTGWSSDWPEWAYEVAREALLHNKKLWVVSAGDPFGRNLHRVLIRWKNI